jgi:hypothetical protein
MKTWMDDKTAIGSLSSKDCFPVNKKYKKY